ncbi:hypothetical protein [Mycobacteroides abscessus]|uniref:hypothetical protein n=1 Tax=Mycobacteroides abscessus TaxID=36809 RepID=UPI0009D10A44|nr:hypothetical protein [Mycobacteroides abscessus]SKI66676.1 Uncharacterised protein [Mycobacteroides abscessus subsp. abscessus]
MNGIFNPLDGDDVPLGEIPDVPALAQRSVEAVRALAEGLVETATTFFLALAEGIAEGYDSVVGDGQ